MEAENRSVLAHYQTHKTQGTGIKQMPNYLTEIYGLTIYLAFSLYNKDSYNFVCKSSFLE